MIRLILFSICFLLFASCSKLETGLQLAPRIVSSRVDDAFDFKSEKLATLRKQIEKDIGLSKKELALRLIIHIDVILELSKKEKVTPEEIRTFIEALKVTQSFAVNQFKDSFAVGLADIKENEITHFKKYIDKKYADDQEEASDKSDFLKKRKKSVLKTFGYFFDNISDEQKKLTEEFVERNYVYFNERLKIRKSFFDSFHLKLLAKEPTLDLTLNYYSGSIKEFSSGPVKAYLEDYYKFQAEFWNMTPAKERQNFRDNVNDYKDELKKIASV